MDDGKYEEYVTGLKAMQEMIEVVSIRETTWYPKIVLPVGTGPTSCLARQDIAEQLDFETWLEECRAKNDVFIPTMEVYYRGETLHLITLPGGKLLTGRFLGCTVLNQKPCEVVVTKDKIIYNEEVGHVVNTGEKVEHTSMVRDMFCKKEGRKLARERAITTIGSYVLESENVIIGNLVEVNHGGPRLHRDNRVIAKNVIFDPTVSILPDYMEIVEVSNGR